MAKLFKSLFGSNEDSIKLGQVNKFISFENDKLILINPLDNETKPIKIISFLGNARIGKSTLMNCYLSHKLNQNIKLFNTSNKMDKHCTSGIDMLLVETGECNLLLLDVQGLDLNNSKDDCKLMLFIYLISSLIIFNPKTILDNTVLSSLSSLTSIMTYIQNKSNKPVLLFRPRDINQESEYNSDENLKEMLSETEDQYSNVRCSINKLFTDIQCQATFYLDKKELKLLSNDKFIEFMEEPTNCFKDFCLTLDKIITTLNPSSTDNFNIGVRKIIEDINLNKKIDYKIFDITMREASCDIKEWIFENIDKSQYDVEMFSDGTQQNYDEVIKPRIDYCELILSLFDKRFEKTTPKIRIAFRHEILETFNKHISAAIKNSSNIAEKELENIYKNDILKYSIKIYHKYHIEDKINYTQEQFIVVITNKIKKTLWLDVKKKEYLIKLENDINDHMKMISDYMLKIKNEYELFLRTEIIKIKTFIKTNGYGLLDDDAEYIYDITKSFSDIINDIIEQFDTNMKSIKYNIYNIEIYLNIIEEFNPHQMDNSFIYSDIYNILLKDPYMYNDLYSKIDNFVSCYINKEDYVCPNSINTIISELGNKIKPSTDDKYCDNSHCEHPRNYIHMYFCVKYEDDFNKMRKDKISDILLKMQDKRNIFPTDNLLAKKIYIDSVKLFELIQEKNSNIKFNKLDIQNFDIINPNQQELTKYAYIVNNLHIHDIYSEEDFNIKYKDILPLLNKKTGDKWLDYNINQVIIDILFRKALEL